MLIENEKLYLGFGSTWNEVLINNKIPIQRAIFVYGLLCILIILNTTEKVIHKESLFKSRIVKSTITVVIIYFINYWIYKALNTDVLCMYNHPRGNPSFGFMIGLLLYQITALIVSEIIFKTKFFLKLTRNKNEI